eukprot:5717233-Amphidinium_carterae.2
MGEPAGNTPAKADGGADLPLPAQSAMKLDEKQVAQSAAQIGVEDVVMVAGPKLVVDLDAQDPEGLKDGGGEPPPPPASC